MSKLYKLFLRWQQLSEVTLVFQKIKQWLEAIAIFSLKRENIFFIKANFQTILEKENNDELKNKEKKIVIHAVR